MDDLISREAALDAINVPDEGCSNPGERHGIIFARVEARRRIREIPSVEAVPLDKLCEFLAGLYGSPCQLAEIDCYPQCEPDENGECYGMRTDDKRCWHDYLTKWMEGLDAKAD